MVAERRRGRRACVEGLSGGTYLLAGEDGRRWGARGQRGVAPLHGRGVSGGSRLVAARRQSSARCGRRPGVLVAGAGLLGLLALTVGGAAAPTPRGGRRRASSCSAPAPALAQTTTQVIEYYTTDALGSVRAVTKQVNGTWQVVARHDFMPFGEEVAPPVPPQDKRLFTGKERDSETGLDYFEARYLPGRPRAVHDGRPCRGDPFKAADHE